MNQTDLIKKVLVGFVIMLAVAVAIIITIWQFIKPSSEITTVKSKPEVSKQDVAADQLPDKFPENLPIEADAKVTQNYNANSRSGYYQATRAYETKLSLAQNLTAFTQYMQANGWKVQTTTNESQYKMVTGTKGIQQLQVSITENTVKKTKTVTISLTELP